jgi:TP901 family phage tail tape measure protein
VASKYSIEAVFKLIDNISAPLDRIAGKGNRVGKALKNDFMAAQRSLDRMGQSLATAGKIAIGAGVAAAGAGLAVATKQFIDYDSAVTAATAKFKDLDVTSATYAESLREVGKVAREVAAITEYNAVDTAGALDKMAMAGLTSKQSMAMLMGTTNLATAAGLDLTSAVDIATDTMGAFRLMTNAAGNALDEAGIAQNMDRVADVFARATNQFNTDMSGMFEAIKKGGPIFADAGQNIETFSTLVGIMANSGIKGSEAGTQLRNIMQHLAGPTDTAAKLMKSMGITIQDANGDYLDIINIIGQFEAATKSMGSAERAAAMSTIFGSRSVAAMNILMVEGSEKLNEYRVGLENAGGTAVNIAEAMRGSIKNKIEVLKSALTELGFKIIETFQEKGVGLIEKLTVAVSQFDPAPIIDALTTTAEVIGNVIGIIWNMREMILGVAIAWGIYKGAMLAAAAIAPILGLIKAVQTLMKAQQGMNAVQAIFNVLLNANPIGLIITAIGVLIGLIILCVKHWKDITAAFVYAGEWIKYVALVIWDNLCVAFQKLTGFITQNSEKVLALISIFIGPFGFIISMVNELRENWGRMVEVFQSEGIIAGLKRLGGVLLSGILAPVQGLLEMLSKIPFIGEKIAPAAGAIQEFRNQLKGIDAATAAEKTPAPVKEPPRRERPGSFSTFREERQPRDAQGPAPVVNTATPSRVTQPVSGVLPVTTAAAPVTTTTMGTVAPQTPGAIKQPALLNLSAAAAPQMTSVAPAVSTWKVPAVTSGMDEDVTPPALAATPTVTKTVPAEVSPAPAAAPVINTAITPASISPVKAPVEYAFPEMIVPADIIKPITVPVEWAFSPGAMPPLPEPVNQTVTRNLVTTVEPVPAVTARPVPVPVEYAFPEMIVPADIIKTVTVPIEWAFSTALPPERAGHIVPSMRPISNSVEQGLTPPEPPMTQAEQIIYSRNDNYENVRVELVPEEGINARVVKGPKSPNVKVVVSGDA